MASSEMRRRRISDQDASAILNGSTPEARPDLVELTQSIAEFRSAAYSAVAQPTAQLAARMEDSAAQSLSPQPQPQPASGVQRRGLTVFTWITGLGLGAKIVLGAGVALAATTGVSAGAGAAGVLPTGLQDTYDTIVSSVIPAGEDSTDGSPTSDPTDTPDPASTEHPDNFGSFVSTGAQDPDKVGRDFGSKVSDAAHENGKGAQSNAPGTGDDQESAGSGDEGETTDTPSDKPDDVGGGKPTR